MRPRNATTLVEVLVAIFIMGIGLMAILALFPLGALQMAQALKDQRAAEAAANATSLARVIWKQACDDDVAVFGPPTTNRLAFRTPFLAGPPPASYYPYPRSHQRFVLALDDPNFHDNPSLNDPRYPNIPTTPPPCPLIPAPQSGGLPPAYPSMPPMPVSGPLAGLTGLDANRSSYPVYVDMFGWLNNSADPRQQYWVAHGATSTPIQQRTNAGNLTGLIPRRPLFIRNPTSPNVDWIRLGIDPPLTSPQRVYKQFSLLDDMTFTDDGLPADSSGQPAGSTPTRIERQGRYSWAYMFRRVRNRDTRTQVDVSVVVYSGRSLDVSTDEKPYYAVGDWDSRTVQLSYNPGDKPALKRGSWVLDATIFNKLGQPDPQGRFYRVVNVEDAGTGLLNIELQTPLAPSGPRPADAPNDKRIFVVMSNVVEVFQIGEISQTSLPRNILDDQEY